jgi:hypothetical protein
VAEEVGERHLLLRRELVVGQLPGDEPEVDVLFEREPALLDFLERGHGGDGLADRAGLEERPLRHGLARLRVQLAVAARPLHLEVLDDGDARARHLVMAQALLNRPRRRALDEDGRQQSTLDPRPPRRRVLPRGLRGGRQQQREREREGQEELQQIHVGPLRMADCG